MLIFDLTHKSSQLIKSQNLYKLSQLSDYIYFFIYTNIELFIDKIKDLKNEKAFK